MLIISTVKSINQTIRLSVQSPRMFYKILLLKSKCLDTEPEQLTPIIFLQLLISKVKANVKTISITKIIWSNGSSTLAYLSRNQTMLVCWLAGSIPSGLGSPVLYHKRTHQWLWTAWGEWK